MIYLIIILLTSMTINGIRLSADEGMILHPIERWAERTLPNYLYMPLIGCVTCMASLWTPIIALLVCTMIGMSWREWFLILFSIPAVAYLNTLLKVILNKLTE